MYATSLPVARAREDGVKMAVGLLCTGALGAVALGAATGSGTPPAGRGLPRLFRCAGLASQCPGSRAGPHPRHPRPGDLRDLRAIAWWQGKSAEDAIASSGGSLGGKGMATAGKILGMIGTVLLVVGIVLGIVLIVFGVAGSS